MQYFKPVKLTPEQIEFLKTTDFDVSVINDDNIVKSEEFILAAGLDEYEMGNLKITNSGIDIEPIDDSKEITEQELAMITSYIKQQVRDTYGVQLQLKEDI